MTENNIIKSCKDEASIDDFLNRKKTKKVDRPLISVDGESDIETHIAKCCQPLPGDEIIGFITPWLWRGHSPLKLQNALNKHQGQPAPPNASTMDPTNSKCILNRYSIIRYRSTKLIKRHFGRAQ